MNGFQAAEAIRKIEESRNRSTSTSNGVGSIPLRPGYQRSKIFALTGLASLDDKRKAFAAGVDGYLIKPVSFKTLNGVFEQLMNG